MGPVSGGDTLGQLGDQLSVLGGLVLVIVQVWRAADVEQGLGQVELFLPPLADAIFKGLYSQATRNMNVNRSRRRNDHRAAVNTDIRVDFSWW